MRALSAGYLLLVLAAIVYYRTTATHIFQRDLAFGIYGVVVAIYLLTRFGLSLAYRPHPDAGLEPSIAIVMPGFNEENAIAASMRSLLAVDYPAEKLEIVAVNGGSTDGTLAEMGKVAENFGGRVRVINFPQNRGKRAAMAAGIRATSADPIVFVDSDSALDQDGLRELVQGFAHENVGAICGHTDVQNADQNWAGEDAGGSLRHRVPSTEGVDLNGQSEYMTVPSNRSFSITNTGRLTFEAWIPPNYLQWNSTSDRFGQGFVNFMGKCAHCAGSCEWGARMYASVNRQGRCNRISAYAFNSSAGLGVGAGWQPVCGLLRPGQWLYVVGEYQTGYTPAAGSRAYRGSVALWVNGVRLVNYRSNGCMSQYGVRPQASDSPLTIGTLAMDSWFPGAMGKVAIYDSLLSQAEISAHFKTMTGKVPSGSCSRPGCTIPVPTTY